MTDKQGEELERIRHYVGTLDDFKNFWDQQAGADTNAYGTPDRQGYGDVHPTRDEVDSPHWKEKEDQIKKEQMREAVDQELGHTDDEPGMMANDLNVIARYAKDLEEMMKELEQSGQEVDFPHWWQSKIVLAKEYIVKAKHYIRAEMEKKLAGLPTFEDFINENMSEHDFSNFRQYLKSIIRKNANVDLHVEPNGTMLKIGYFSTQYPSFAHLPKELPTNIIEKLRPVLTELGISIMSTQKRDPITDKMMRFTLITAPNAKVLKKLKDFSF